MTVLSALTPLTPLLSLFLLAAPAASGAPTDPVPADPAPVESAVGESRPAAGWPVPGPAGGPRPVVVGLWDPPPTPWAAGHRGVDLATARGAEVRAAASGRVAFAGQVAGRGVLTIELDDGGSPPLRITHEPVLAAVEVGERVSAGQLVGELAAGPFHCPSACLHWGLLRGETYLDPLSLLPAHLLGAGPVRLLPTEGVPLPDGGAGDGGGAV
ncbi:murein hydrolase activator EnvC family protein [Streptomyces mayteni]